MPEVAKEAIRNPGKFDAVAAISNILQAEKAPPNSAPAANTPPSPAPQPEEAVQPETPESQPEPAPNQEVEGSAPEISEDALYATPLEVPVKGDDGKEVVKKLTVKELRDGYMMQQDYSRKTAELARQRDEVPEKIRQAVESERTAYQKELQALQNTVLEVAAQELKDVNWNDLASNDPARYVQLRNRADQIQSTLAAIKTRQEEADKKAKQEQGQIRQKIARESVSILERDIPGWNDDLYTKVLKSGEKFGFKREEVADWVDARAIKLLHTAMLYDDLKAGKPVIQNKVVTPPKVVKAGAAPSVTQAQTRAEDSMKKLRSSGRIEDAAAVIRARMG